MESKGFKKLIAWQKAYALALEIYSLTKKYPDCELYSLVSQIRRAGISISANIAEGYARKHRKEYLHFLNIANGSLAEVETLLLFSRDLKYITEDEYAGVEDKRQETAKVLCGLIKKLTP